VDENLVNSVAAHVGGRKAVPDSLIKAESLATDQHQLRQELRLGKQMETQIKRL
jgi:hypothetical protein